MSTLLEEARIPPSTTMRMIYLAKILEALLRAGITFHDSSFAAEIQVSQNTCGTYN